MNDSTSMEVRHSAPLIGVLVSHLFSEIISADQSGTVCVWQASTGRLRQRHAEAHGKQRLTAAALDHSGRRLITADDVGIVKIW